ncbi:PTS sugar transporter subunit IIB [Streptococcus penaeicida]|uniref:PTS sugar transporter subunit IIB n=1 Tax=Streptococcus penaeicida TaxID=1765960 RepID=A0A2N8LAS6_9STRE|nr:PTS sugar transporter subunit IIB [Streptococcus penaeicida]PND47265.1 PTS sugar transporter subunit IIB [Streptococcus penaeicida]
MSQEKILLVCSAGMSTSLLVTKMKDYINASGLDYDVNAVASSEAIDYAVENKVNVILLGPQVRFMEGQFKKALAEYNIPIDLISPQNYGTMNGANVVKQAQDLMAK